LREDMPTSMGQAPGTPALDSWFLRDRGYLNARWRMRKRSQCQGGRSRAAGLAEQCITKTTSPGAGSVSFMRDRENLARPRGRRSASTGF